MLHNRKLTEDPQGPGLSSRGSRGVWYIKAMILPLYRLTCECQRNCWWPKEVIWGFSQIPHHPPATLRLKRQVDLSPNLRSVTY